MSQRTIRNSVIATVLGIGLLAPIFLAFPSKSGAESRTPVRTSTTTQNIVLCRTGRLTDIVVPEKVLDVVMSNSSNFKLATIRYKSQTYLVIKPLKEQSSSDLIIFGVNRVHYLRVKTVPKGQHYAERVDLRDQRPDQRHF